jgi:hypothetical protein
MGDFDELRYPFDSLLEFLRGGYFLERAGLHLTIALVVFTVLTVRVMLGRGPVVQRLITVFFAGTVYNNPSFSVLGGLHFNEVAGVLAAMWICVSLLGGLTMDVRRVGVPILVGGLVLLAHAAFVSVWHVTLLPDTGTAIMRGVLIARVFVLGIIVIGIETLYRTDADFDALMQTIVLYGVAAILIYFLQVGVFLSGTRPYGTYWDAGFTGIPSFGSVSIERGHFGKFLVVLFPCFAWAAAKRRRWLPMLLFFVVTLVNFSASSMSFLAGYLVITLLVLHRYVIRPSALKWAVPAAAAVLILASRFGEQYGGLIRKIVDLGLKGDAGGGRGFSVLDAYISAYPLGIGYSGSTLRNVGMLPPINMGAYAMASQLSFLIIPVFAGFLWLTYRVMRSTLRISDPIMAGLLVGGMLMAVLIDLVDVLWFVPTLWLPLIVGDGLAHTQAQVGEAAPSEAAPAVWDSPATVH